MASGFSVRLQIKEQANCTRAFQRTHDARSLAKPRDLYERTHVSGKTAHQRNRRLSRFNANSKT